MSSEASKPGRWLAGTAWKLQAGVEAGIVKARSALDARTKAPSAQEVLARDAGHFGLGVTHGLCGMSTGLLNGLGCAEQAVTDPAFDARAAQSVARVAAHPVVLGHALTTALAASFREDAPYAAGDYLSLLAPTSAGFAVAGVPGAVAGGLAGCVAAAFSPQPPPAITTPDE